MAKVSIALRGWRFDESEVFDDDGNFRPLEEIGDDARTRLVRLTTIHDQPCDACRLVHGDDHVERCNVAAVVYGEPRAEVLLCDAHEDDFYYWYREAGGERYRGTHEFQTEFRTWFADGGRAPDDYRGIEHVARDQASIPSPDVPDLDELTVDLPEERRERYDLLDAGDGADGDDGGDDVDFDGVDFDVDYPGGS